MRFGFIVVLLLASVGCSKSIGDACTTNVDCSISGDRFCDTAPPNGYCSIDGCDIDSCPGDSVCIRFYSPVKDRPCTFDPNSAKGSCATDERCVCDSSESGTSCDTGTAHCAPENSERRWCMKRCGGNGDCRDGYECRNTGTMGAESVPALDRPAGEPATFCVSSGQIS
jgi:hypothetical protein